MLPKVVHSDDFPVPFGRYSLLKKLGAGAYARVFLAQLSGLAGFRKLVALKVVREKYAQRPEDFIREGRLCGLLKHRNVVDTYEIGVHEGQSYIAMELIEGSSLGALCARGAMPPSVVLEVGIEVCRGLAYAHGLEGQEGHMGLVHRDMKPSNILVGWDGTVKVADFGIAALTGLRGPDVPSSAGSPAYMSPEQWTRQPIDHRADLFSLSAVLYELAMGERLNPQTRIDELMKASVCMGERLAQTDLVARMNGRIRGFGDVVAKGLAQAPADRFVDAAAYGEALRTLQRRVGLEPRLERWLSDTVDRAEFYWQAGLAALHAPIPLGGVASADETMGWPIDLSSGVGPQWRGGVPEQRAATLPDIIPLTDRKVHLSNRVVKTAAEDVSLTPKEVALLRYVVQRPAVDIPTEDLLANVWEYHPNANTRAVHHAVQRLRRKLEVDAGKPRHLLTVRGVGYRFEPVAKKEKVTTLGPERSTFVGRGDDLQALSERFEGGARLVTILGIGGAGKTRLARAYGRSLNHPVLFVDLVNASTEEEVISEALRAIDVEPGVDPGAQWLRILARMSPLTVIADNFEGVLAHGPNTVQHWLDGEPGLRVLATSREGLGLEGESVMDLGPMSEADGVALLTDRVAAVGCLATLTDGESSEIVRRVDGVPLAIELAAAQLRFQTVSSLLARLETEMHALAAVNRAVPARHRSLSAALQGSWDALSANLQTALSQCALFRGGFTAEAAATVVEIDGDVWGALYELRNCGLLTSRQGRMDLLEPVRQFVLAVGPADHGAILRHGEWVRSWLDEHRRSRRQVVRAESANLRVAIERTAPIAPDLAATLLLESSDVLWERGSLNWVAEPLHQVQEAVTSVETRLNLEMLAGTFAMRAGDFRRAVDLMAVTYTAAKDAACLDIACRAAGMAQACTNYLGEKKDTDWYGRLLAFDGQVGPRAQERIWKAHFSTALREDDYEMALRFAQKVSDRARQEGHDEALVSALNGEAWSYLYLARPVDAMDRLWEGIDLAQVRGFGFSLAIVRGTLGFAMVQTGDVERALALVQESIEDQRKGGLSVSDYLWLTAAHAATALGREDDARMYGDLARRQGRGSMGGDIGLLEGHLCQQRGDLVSAQRAFREAGRIYARVGESRFEAMSGWMLATALAPAALDETDGAVGEQIEALLAPSSDPRVSDARAQLFYGLCRDHVAWLQGTSLKDLPAFSEVRTRLASPAQAGEMPAHWMWTRLRYGLMSEP